jgi:hypothetical protein
MSGDDSPRLSWGQVLGIQFPHRLARESLRAALFPPHRRLIMFLNRVRMREDRTLSIRYEDEFLDDLLNGRSIQDAIDSIRFWKNRSDRFRFVIPSTRKVIVAYSASMQR